MNGINKILMIYPNFSGLRVPLALAILSAKFKEMGIDVKVFDTTFFQLEQKPDFELMEKRRVVKKSQIELMLGEFVYVDLKEETKKVVTEYQPDLIVTSVLERGYKWCDIMVTACKEVAPDVPLIACGILATIYPDILVQHPCIDYVCRGEGEIFMEDFIKYHHDEKKLKQIPNLMYQDAVGQIISNPLGPLTNMNEVPFQDWEAFDKRHLYKPYDGNVWVGGSFEFSRGCYKQCSFCVAPSLRNDYSNEGMKKYHRTKDPEYAIAEIKQKKEQYGMTFLAMCDTDFISAVPKDIFFEFCKLYKEEINIPWIMQTSAESFSEDKLKALVDSGCVSASIGVESGSQYIRDNVIIKSASKARLKKTFAMCRDYNFRTTANYMMGVPYETEENIWDTIKFNREINPPSIAITFFVPFLGTELYDICLKEGFYKGFDPSQNVYKYSPLTMPQLSSEKIDEMIKYFVDDFSEYQVDIKNISQETIDNNYQYVEKLYGGTLPDVNKTLKENGEINDFNAPQFLDLDEAM